MAEGGSATNLYFLSVSAVILISTHKITHNLASHRAVRRVPFGPA